MPSEISDEALDFLLARAGLSLNDAQKAELKGSMPVSRRWPNGCASRAGVWPSRR